MTSRSLIGAIREALPQDNALRVGQVVAVVSTVATVSLDGVEAPWPRLSSYTATVGDVVLLLRNGGDWIILGKIVGV